jgi:hypothetical protein
LSSLNKKKIKKKERRKKKNKGVEEVENEIEEKR